MTSEIIEGESIAIDYDTYCTPFICGECGECVISRVVKNYSSFPEIFHIPKGCDHFAVLKVSENDFSTLNAEDRRELSKKSRVFWDSTEESVFIVVPRDLLPSVKRIMEKGRAEMVPSL